MTGRLLQIPIGIEHPSFSNRCFQRHPGAGLSSFVPSANDSPPVWIIGTVNLRKTGIDGAVLWGAEGALLKWT
jgi:hypothetical protein